MKFEYDTPTETRKPCAVLYRFNGEDDRKCLAVQAQSGKMVWFYDTGLPSVQSNGFPDDDVIRKFYPGDKITITF